MNGLSLLATTISVLSFPLVFLALLYPKIASPRWGRWPGFFLYLGISAGGLLVAVFTETAPDFRVEDWEVMDWLVLLLGGTCILALMTRKWWWKRLRTGEASFFEPASDSPEGRQVKTGRRRKKENHPF